MHKYVVDEQIFPLITDRKPREENSFVLSLEPYFCYFLMQNKSLKTEQHLH